MYAVGDGRVDLIEIPIVLVLWAYPNYVGVKRQFVRDEPNLAVGWTKGDRCEAGADFDNRAASAQVFPGPDYENWKARNGGHEPFVLLFTKQWCGPDGISIALQRGAYPNLRALGFEDGNAKNPASSLQFFDPASGSIETPTSPGGPVPPFEFLPLVLRMHTADYNQSPLGYKQAIDRCPPPDVKIPWENAYCGKIDTALTVVESFDSYDNVYNKGTDTFDDYYLGKISWIEVLRGPNWRDESEVIVYDQEHFAGNYASYKAPNDILLTQMPSGFGDTIRSVQINP